MNFRQSIYVSALIHMLLLSSMFAFAQIGRGVLDAYRRAVPVSLVSAGFEIGAMAGAVKSKIKPLPPIPQKSAPLPVDAYQEKPKEIAQESTTAAQQEEAIEHIALIGNLGDTGDGQTRMSTEAGHDGASEAGLISPEQWALISAAIERSKSYPRLARERGIEGKVKLRFKVAPSGVVNIVEIVESSGSEVLDEASIRAVSRAAPMPYVTGWVEVPIVYVLK